MRIVHIRKLIVFAWLAMSAPLGAVAQTQGDKSPANIDPDNWAESQLMKSITLTDLLSRRPFTPLGLSASMDPDIPSHVDGKRIAITNELLKSHLTQQMQSRLQSRLQQVPKMLQNEDLPANQLLKVEPGTRDVVDLQLQSDSWRSIVQRDRQTAAAQLYDALLAGRPATLDEMLKIAGGQEKYSAELANLSKLAKSDTNEESVDQNGDSSAVWFVLAYHAAVSGDLPLARRSWNALAEQSPGIRLDPMVRIRLWQMLK